MYQRLKKNIPQNNTPEQLSGGYFRVPNFIFDLPISVNAIIVLTNLCRRADKFGHCFPSIKRICIDTKIKSPNTIRKAINELSALNLIRQLSPANGGGSNRYVLSDSILEVLNRRGKEVTKCGPCSAVEHTPSSINQPPAQQLSTKEYTEKENTHKEVMCALNQVQLDHLVKDWIRVFSDTHDKDSNESTRQIRENLIKVAQSLSEKLPTAQSEELNRYTSGIIEWYIKANEDTDLSRGNEWTYRGERKTARLAKNFETIWTDYWAVNRPVTEWEPPRDLLERKGDVTHDRLKEAFNKLPWYRKSKSHLTGGVNA